MKKHETQSLVSMKTGERGVIVALENDARQRSRLMAQGIFIGACVEALYVDAQQGIFVIAIEDSRIALEREVGSQVFVAAVNCPHQPSAHHEFWRKICRKRWRFGRMKHGCC